MVSNNGIPHRALVVEDETAFKNLVVNLLKMENIESVTAESVKEAKALIEENGHIDILITDYKLPDGTGADVIKYARDHRSNIPAMVISGVDEEEVKYPSYLAGANIILWKPLKEAEFLMIVKNLTSLSDAYINLQGAETVIMALTAALEARDSYTQGHGQRVANFSLEIYDLLGLNNKEERNALYMGALLHDIGKIGIPDGTLQSTENLTEEEREMINQHTIVGYDICKNLEGLKPSLGIIKYHHERLDGSGYPDGLKSEDIPVLAQIVAVPDIWDAVTTKRTYRKEMTHKQALAVLDKEAKDGKLNKGFLAVFKTIIEKSKSS